MQGIFTRKEQLGKFHRLAHVLKLRLYSEDKGIYVPHQQELLHFVKIQVFFFLINVVSFSFFIYSLTQSGYQAKKRYMLEMFSRRLAVFIEKEVLNISIELERQNF